MVEPGKLELALSLNLTLTQLKVDQTYIFFVITSLYIPHSSKIKVTFIYLGHTAQLSDLSSPSGIEYMSLAVEA